MQTCEVCDGDIVMNIDLGMGFAGSTASASDLTKDGAVKAKEATGTGTKTVAAAAEGSGGDDI